MLLIPTLLCPKSWEQMSGHDAERFCTYCKKSVHNLEALSVSERLALLTSPAASVCSRYRVAIRRPAKGQKEAYTRHLLKYGAAVALTGSVFLVLWELQSQGDLSRIYRVFKSSDGSAMPEHLYEERRVMMMGMVCTVDDMKLAEQRAQARLDTREAAAHLDLQLDEREIERAILNSKLRPPTPERPKIPIQLDTPGH